jgi:hypothetical protein
MIHNSWYEEIQSGMSKQICPNNAVVDVDWTVTIPPTCLAVLADQSQQWNPKSQSSCDNFSYGSLFQLFFYT